MTFDNLLEDLERLLVTPRSISGGLRQLGQRMSMRCPEASDVASLVIKLYDPCLDERWIFALWPSTQLLFATTATRLVARVSNYITGGLVDVQVECEDCGVVSSLLMIGPPSTPRPTIKEI